MHVFSLLIDICEKSLEMKKKREIWNELISIVLIKEKKILHFTQYVLCFAHLIN